MTDPVYLPVEHPLLNVGADVRSRTRRYGDSDKPVGGAYLDTEVDGDGVISYLVVDTHWGRPVWHHLGEMEVDWGLYSGLVRTDVLEDRLAVIAQDIARRPAPYGGTKRHTAALVRLQSAVA